MLAQVAGIALDDVTMASVVAALGSNQQPVAIDRARIDRQIRELALEHAGGLLGDDTYLDAPEGAPRAARRHRGAHGRRAYPAIAQSSGSAPSASPSKPQTYRRRRQT